MKKNILPLVLSSFILMGGISETLSSDNAPKYALHDIFEDPTAPQRVINLAATQGQFPTVEDFLRIAPAVDTNHAFLPRAHTYLDLVSELKRLGMNDMVSHKAIDALFEGLFFNSFYPMYKLKLIGVTLSIEIEAVCQKMDSLINPTSALLFLLGGLVNNDCNRPYIYVDTVHFYQAVNNLLERGANKKTVSPTTQLSAHSAFLRTYLKNDLPNEDSSDEARNLIVSFAKQGFFPTDSDFDFVHKLIFSDELKPEPFNKYCDLITELKECGMSADFVDKVKNMYLDNNIVWKEIYRLFKESPNSGSASFRPFLTKFDQL